MKAILISIQPKYVKKILNMEKTLEIRRTMPKCDLPIDVYIYCTKNQGKKNYISIVKIDLSNGDKYEWKLNGKVVAKFRLNDIKNIFAIHMPFNYFYKATDLTLQQLTDKSCLTQIELDEYLRRKKGYAWIIDDLEILDLPLTISKPPQSWCYIEI